MQFRAGELLRHKRTGRRAHIVRIIEVGGISHRKVDPAEGGLAYIVSITPSGTGATTEALWRESDVEFSLRDPGDRSVESPSHEPVNHSNS